MGLFEEDVKRDMADPAYAQGWHEAGFELTLSCLAPQLSQSSDQFASAFSMTSGKVASTTAAFQFNAVPAWSAPMPQAEPAVAK
jgi:hypothetical protein